MCQASRQPPGPVGSRENAHRARGWTRPHLEVEDATLAHWEVGHIHPLTLQGPARVQDTLMLLQGPTHYDETGDVGYTRTHSLCCNDMLLLSLVESSHSLWEGHVAVTTYLHIHTHMHLDGHVVGLGGSTSEHYLPGVCPYQVRHLLYRRWEQST